MSIGSIKNKSILVILLIFILGLIVILLSYSCLFYPSLEKTENEEYFWVTISGKVSPDNNISKLLEKDTETYLKNRPNFVWVFNDYYSLDQLCRSERISMSEIQWINTIGQYHISFQLPINMNIVVTTECAGCNKKKIYVEKNNTSIQLDLLWGIDNCAEEFEIFEDPLKQIEHLERILVGAENTLQYADIDLTKKEQIRKEDISQANDFLQLARNEKNETQKLIFALQSQWFYQRAKYRISFEQLEKCFLDFNKTLSKFNNSLCYIPNYESYEKYGYEQGNSIGHYRI